MSSFETKINDHLFATLLNQILRFVEESPGLEVREKGTNHGTA
jgi:hypothetical protein